VNEDEAELIRRSRQGSTEAFTEIVLRYQARVRAYIGQFVRHPDVVDDLAQETFVGAYRSLGGYKDSFPFGPWLFQIARNRTLDHLKLEARRRARETCRWELTLAEARVRQIESGEAQELEALEECIERLPGHSAGLISDHYFRSRSAAEIARETGRNESAVRMMLLRIRQILRQCIEKRVLGPGGLR